MSILYTEASANISAGIGWCGSNFNRRRRKWLLNSVTCSPFFRLSSSHSRLTRSKAWDGINLAFSIVQNMDHVMCVLIGKQCTAQTAASPFSCRTTCSPQPVVPTHPMAWVALLKCRSEAKRKAVTSSKVRLPSYIRRLDDLTEQPQLPDGPGVGSAEPRIMNEPEVGSKEPQIATGLGGGWKVVSAGVGRTWFVVSRWISRSNTLSSDSRLLFSD